MAAIEVHQISKSFGETKAVKDMSFNVNDGELFGLIGPDGAGKTTLIKILVTLQKPDSGSAKVDGQDVVSGYHHIRNIIGYMPGKFALYQDLSIEENMSFFADIFGTKIEEQMELMGDIYKQIEPFKKRKAGQLSGGMKQKLALCCALIHKPKILVLDEPTTGVDAVSRREFWDMLSHIKKQGISILVSTPYMDEAARCDRIALVQEGSIIALDTPKGIIKDFAHPIFGIKGDNNYHLIEELKNMPGLRSLYPSGEYAHLVMDDKNQSSEEIKNYAAAKTHQKIEIEPIEADIEDCFIEMMQHG
ncbi:MAG: ABC transporter ATP-binding protein [Bacteroidetes bacterium]|nr:ABC transporter ATP-binding protein [Bacteroidota bacterium]MBU1483587.1 ABC transporter ATP-binding protein [Bacteroidota bacterium]MBU2045913.1 ABC transporter ATP-binding protein [Bacteroidota bacterium]MBU2267990.1 ABC transporter ATP-binding protein [Bacteroidota bacterium]MBU2375022.1 ABC transporter ATP-binding protein [Bacteroidota bacterium]